jgi:arginase
LHHQLGTVSGALQISSNVGLIYFDLDVDLHTPQTTTDGALDWMGVAHMLGVEGAVRDLKELGPRSPLLPADSVFLFAYKNVDSAEQQLIDSLGIRGIHADNVASNPRGAGLQAALDWGQRFNHLLIHLDVDVIDLILPSRVGEWRKGYTPPSLLEFVLDQVQRCPLRLSINNPEAD